MKIKVLPVLLCSLLISACGGSSPTPANNTDNAGTTTLALQCDLGTSFTPVATAEVSPTTGTAKATVIAVHGKNGSPLRPHMQTLKTELNAADYDVVMPYMPWSDLTWSGSLCEGMTQLNALIDTEVAAGKSVILLGHSLAGPIVLSYAALDNTAKPDGIAVIAPGHFIHQSALLANEHASSITSAKSMVNSGQGDQFATFTTYNTGAAVTISATASDYLSFHDTEQFPDIEISTPLVTLPILWLAGVDDPVTTSAKNFGLTDLIPDSASNSYKEIAGDHFTIMDTVATELDTWRQSI